MLEVPVSAHDGAHAYLDKGFENIRPIVDASMDGEVICVGMRDHMDCCDAMKELVDYLHSKGAHFSTLTQTASEHYERHGS